MKKLSTLVFFVNKFTGQQSEAGDLDYRDFLTDEEDEAEFSPSAASIRNIMDFAHSYEVLDSDSTGQIELITN